MEQMDEENAVMSRLDRLTLKGFKSIREVELSFGNLNVLIGPNGAGKSNLLSFFRFLGAISQHRFQLFVGKEGGANAILHHGRKRTPELVTSVSFTLKEGSLEFGFTLVGAAPDKLLVAHENLKLRRGDETTEQDSYSEPHEEAYSFFSGPRSQNEELLASAVNGLAYYHFHDTSADAPIKLNCRLNDNRSLRADGGNLAAFLFMLKAAHPARYERIRATIQMAAPFFDDFVLQPDALDPGSIHLEWRERDADTPFFAHQFSDGTLRFIALTTALLQPELPGGPRTILIDEPELGMHPYALTLLASMMRAASQATQLIISTQSVTLLDELAEPEDVIVVERKGSQSTFRRLDIAQLEGWLDEYSLGELWKKNVLGGRPSL
jgi:predicted ATPase